MRNPLRSSLWLLCLFVLAACNKNNDDETPSKKELLTSGQWRVTGVVANPPVAVGPVAISDLYAFLEPCQKDNTYLFKTDGTVEVNEDATKCDPADPQTTTGSWALSSDEKSIVIDGQTVTILELTAAKLRVSGPYALPTGPTVTAEVTFSK